MGLSPVQEVEGCAALSSAAQQSNVMITPYYSKDLSSLSGVSNLQPVDHNPVGEGNFCLFVL